MVKKIVLLGLIASLAFTLILSQAALGVTKILIRSHTNPRSISMLKEMIEKFEKENPDIDVELESKPGAQYEELLMVSLAAGAGPDIFRVGDWNMLRYIDKNMISPFIPQAFGYGSAQDVVDEYIPGVLSIQYHDGKLYALPEDITPLLLGVNMDILEEAGIGVPPSDYQEFIDTGVKTTKVNDDGQRIISGFEWRYRHELWNTIQFAPLLRGYGASLFDQTGKKLLLDSPQGLKAVQYYYDTVHKWEFSSPTFSLSEGVHFNQGNVAMYSGGAWLNRLVAATGIVKNWEVTTWDIGPTKNTAIYAWNYGLNSATKNQEEASKLVGFIHRKDNFNQVMEHTGWIQGRKIWSEMDYVRENPKVRPWFDALSSAQYMDPLLEFPRVSKAITKMLENMAEGGMQPKEALNIAVSEIKRAMR